jgi:hypothetical protein
MLFQTFRELEIISLFKQGKRLSYGFYYTPEIVFLFKLGKITYVDYLTLLRLVWKRSA